MPVSLFRFRRGIRATSLPGDIIVTTAGDTDSSGSFGVFALSTANGDIEITASEGTITSKQAGIYANMSVESAGNIVISGSANIVAEGQDVAQVRSPQTASPPIRAVLPISRST
ncbi:MAG: hypothetical protein ACKOED_05605 [Aestuariivirga sp.]|uniref:hypothetical protein n=1 Tax=Aestuariivirga sp. TaxID=2650926 RepID=UPI0038D229F5